MYHSVHGEKLKSADMGDKTGFLRPSHILCMGEYPTSIEIVKLWSNTYSNL